MCGPPQPVVLRPPGNPHDRHQQVGQDAVGVACAALAQGAAPFPEQRDLFAVQPEQRLAPQRNGLDQARPPFRRIAAEQLPQRAPRALVFLEDEPERARTNGLVFDQRRIFGHDSAVGGFHAELDIMQQVGEERPVARGAAEQFEGPGVFLADAFERVPAPYQPGTLKRAWLQLNTHGIARRSLMVRRPVRRAGREPIGSIRWHRQASRPRKLHEAFRVDQRAVSVAACRASRSNCASAGCGSLPASRLRSIVHRAAPATSRSRCCAAVSLLAYFCDTASPCSVTRSSPHSVPGESDSRKSCVGPEPRPMVPPRP